jgi:hypothetical protein
MGKGVVGNTGSMRTNWRKLEYKVKKYCKEIKEENWSKTTEIKQD